MANRNNNFNTNRVFDANNEKYWIADLFGEWVEHFENKEDFENSFNEKRENKIEFTWNDINE